MLDPEALVARAAGCGVRVLSVTDHDTTASTASVMRAAAARGLTAIAGIEITAIEDGRDVHVLGYFIDPEHPRLRTFLEQQRHDRLRRVRAIGARLATLGMPVDTEALVREAEVCTGRSIGRPAIADALIAAGHVRDRDEAFHRWLGKDCPAYVPREGVSVSEVVAIVHDAGGLASLAHPGILALDNLITAAARRGLDAIEAYHSEHSSGMQQHYVRLARTLGIAVTGGSDYHGDGLHGVVCPGAVALPDDDFTAFCALARKR